MTKMVNVSKEEYQYCINFLIKGLKQNWYDIIPLVKEFMQKHEHTINCVNDIDDLSYLYDIDKTGFQLNEFLKNHNFINDNIAQIVKQANYIIGSVYQQGF